MQIEIVAGADPRRDEQKAAILERFGKLLDTLTDAEFAAIRRPGNETWLDGEIERVVHRVVGRKTPAPASRIGRGL